jgi:hypothetical protein
MFVYDSLPAIIYSEFSFGTAEISLAIYWNVTLNMLFNLRKCLKIPTPLNIFLFYPFTLNGVYAYRNYLL